MAAISIYVSISFIIITFITLWFFYKASKSKTFILGALIWMLAVTLLAFNGFYRNVDAFPPRLIFLIIPWVLFVIGLFITNKGREFIAGLDIKWLTLLHIVRIPVEVVLLYVFLAGLIPELMTFEGCNYDILSGITAPIVYYLVFINKRMGNKGLLVWNIICLVLLINIIVIANLSAQSPFQQLAFNQPNIGITYFPFVWLPAVVVPIVLFSHLVAIKQLWLQIKKSNKGI